MEEKKKIPIFFRDEQIFWMSLILITLFFTSSMYLFVWKRFKRTETQLVSLVDSYEASIVSSREELARRELLIQSEEKISQVLWSELNFFLPSSPALPRLILELASLTAQNGFQLESLRLLNTSSQGNGRTTLNTSSSVKGVVPVSFDISLKGNSGYQAFSRLLDTILSSLRFLGVTNFSYRPDTENYTFSLRGFWFQPTSKILEDAQKKDIPRLITLMENFFGSEKFLALKAWSETTEIEEGEKIYSSGGTPENTLSLSVFDPGSGENLVLSWEGRDLEGKKVHIFRSLSPLSSGEEIAIVESSLTYYIDQNIEVNRPYHYRAKLSDASENFSAATEVVVGIAKDQIPPSLPEEIRIELADEKRAILYWKNPREEDFDSINIYRSREEMSLGTLVGRQIKGETFEDALPESEVTYYYFLSALDKHGNESQIVPLKNLIGKTLPFE